jgi:hypothetical protein
LCSVRLGGWGSRSIPAGLSRPAVGESCRVPRGRRWSCRSGARPCGPPLVEDTAEDVTAADHGWRVPSRLGCLAGRGGERERTVRALGVVMSDVVAHRAFEMTTAGDQEVVQAVFAGSADPSLGERVCLRRTARRSPLTPRSRLRTRRSEAK